MLKIEHIPINNSILEINKCIDMRLHYNNHMHILGIIHCQQPSTNYQTCISQQQQRVTRPAGLSKDKKIVFFIATCLFIASMIGYNLRGYYYIAFEPEKESLSIEQKSGIKQQYLQKHYNQGLKQYYQQIEQTVTIIKTRRKEESKQKKYRIIINGFEDCDQKHCQQAIASIINKFVGTQIIWMTKGNRLKQAYNSSTYFYILTQYLSLRGVQFDVFVQDVQANYFFVNNHQDIWVDQWVLFLTNFMIVQGHTIDEFIGQADDFAIYAHKFPTELSINKKANLSTISRHKIIQNAYLLPNKMLKILTPLNFAYQDVYRFQELLIIPSLALFQLVQRVKQHNFIDFIIKKSRESKNLTEFRLKQRPKQIKQSGHICFIGTPTLPSMNSIQQLNNYINVFEQYLRTQRKVQPFSVFVGLVYQIDNLPLLKLQQAIKKVLNLSAYGLNTRFRIRSNKVVASLQMYEGSRRYCPEGSTIFSSRFNTHPNIKEIYKSIQQSDLCRSNNLYLIPNYQDQNNKKTAFERIDIKSSIENKQRRQYIPLHAKYFFNAVIVCSQLILSMRLSVFKWEAHQFYETQASFSIAMLEKGRTNQYFQSLALYQVVNPRNMSELEKKQIKGMQYRQIQRLIYKGRQSFYTLSELNNHGYKNNAPEIIPKIIHQIWLSNEKQPQPVKVALAETLRSANPDFEYKLWTWQNVTRNNFPVTYDGILKIIKVCKLLNQNYLAAATDMMRIELLFRYGGFYMDFKTEGKRSLQPFLRYQQMYHIADKKYLLNSFIATVQGNRHFYQILKQFCNPNYYPFLFMSSLSWENTGGPKIASSYLEREMYTEVLDFRQFISGGQQPCMYSFDPKPLDPDQKLFTGMTTFSSKYEYKVKIPCKRDMQKYLQYYDMLGRSYHQKSTSSYS